MKTRLFMTIVIPTLFLISFPVFASSAISSVESLTNGKNQVLKKNNKRIKPAPNINPAKSIAPTRIFLPKIIGGTKVHAGTYPWMANLLDLFEPYGPSAHYCGGSLISEDVILTAAHCVAPRGPGDLLSTQPNELEVTVGANNLRYITAQDRIAVSAIYIHPEYNNTDYDNDIALLKLVTPVNNTTLEYIDPILMQQIVHNDNLKVIGWGTTDNQTYVQPDILQEVQVPYINLNICKDTMQKSENLVGSNQICAGAINGGKDSCYGDSGGPLFYTNSGKYFQVGIVSWGDGCAVPGFYGVYTKVANYNEWIEDSGDQLNLAQYNSFGGQGVNNDSTIQVSALNWSKQSKLIKSVSISTSDNFSILQDPCTDRTLAMNEACNLEIKFEPEQSGPSMATLSVITESGKTTTALLSGVGLALVDYSSAVDNDVLELYTGGDYMWTEDSLVIGSINGSALRSGKILDGEKSYFSTRVKGSGTLTFNWRLSSNLNVNMLSVIIDRKKYLRLDNDTPWSMETIMLGAGEHIITWVYVDSASASSESGAGWIDKVNWVANQ